MGWNPFKEAQNKANQAIDDIIKPGAQKAVDTIIKPATKGATDVIWKLRRETWDTLEKKSKSVVDEVDEQVIDKVENAVTKQVPRAITKELPKIVEKEVPALLEKAAKEIAEQASKKSIKEVLDNAADVIETLAPSSFSLTFGIELALVVQGEVTVSVSIPNPVARLTEIRKWAKKPPSGRSQIIDCIKDFGPQSISVEGKISGNGITAEWDGDEKYDRVDAFLKKHGVN